MFAGLGGGLRCKRVETIQDLMNTGQQLSLHTTLHCKSSKCGRFVKVLWLNHIEPIPISYIFLHHFEVDSSLFHWWHKSSDRRFIAWSCAWSSWSDVRPHWATLIRWNVRPMHVLVSLWEHRFAWQPGSRYEGNLVFFVPPTLECAECHVQFCPLHLCAFYMISSVWSVFLLKAFSLSMWIELYKISSFHKI